MRKLYEIFHILHFQKRKVSAETIHGNTVPNLKALAQNTTNDIIFHRVCKLFVALLA